MRIVIIVLALISANVWADKPAWAGKGKPTAEQLEAHKAAMNAKEDVEEQEEGKKKKSDRLMKEKKIKNEKKLKKEREPQAKERDRLAGKKVDQERNETDKGSQKAQEQREQNSNKWWRFWEGE
jgi:hypothetical protein